MPYSNLTQLNTYEFGNKTDVDDLTTEIDNRFKSPATVTEHAATATSVEAGIPVVYSLDIADAVSGSYDLTMPARFRLTDVVVTKADAAASAANHVTVMSTAAAITDQISINVAEHVVARAGTVNDANSRIAAGGLLRVAVHKAGGNASCTVVVTGYHT